jgi:hypothetical protein
MDEKEWAVQKAKEVREKRDRENAENQIRLLNEKLRAEAAPKLWNEFVERIQARVKSLNQALGENALQFYLEKPTEISVSANQGMSRISAELRNLELRCMLPGTSTEYPITVIKGQATFTSASGMSYAGSGLTPDNVAQAILDSLIGVL